MARYILLSMDDNDRADALITKLSSVRGLEIVGLFAKPQRTCKCTKTKGRGYTRGQRLGWWVCSLCGRPSTRWAASAQAVVSQAVNLLEGVDQNIAKLDQLYPPEPITEKKRRY